MSEPKVTARERRVAAFQKWLKNADACARGRRFASGKTAHEAWAKTKYRHALFVGWFANTALSYDICMCPHCVRSAPEFERIKASIKLPKRFDWERSA